MNNQLKLTVGVSGAVLGLIVGIGIGLIVNSGGGDEPMRPVVSSIVDTTVPPVTTSDAPIAVAP
jgi:ABC-type dipeptide/oligopeptide/nickel transport system permease subunit